MPTKNIQDVVAEFDERWQAFEKALKKSGNRDGWIMRKLYPILKADHKEHKEWLTTTLTQLVKEVEEGERERLSKKVVVYVSSDSSHYELSHEDRLKVNAQEVIIYLADKVDGVWGDDWNDAPDEHNSGAPYPETAQGLEKIFVTLGKPLQALTPPTSDVTEKEEYD